MSRKWRVEYQVSVEKFPRPLPQLWTSSYARQGHRGLRWTRRTLSSRDGEWISTILRSVGKRDVEVGSFVLLVVSFALSWLEVASYSCRAQRIYVNMWRRKRNICHKGRDLTFFQKRRKKGYNNKKRHWDDLVGHPVVHVTHWNELWTSISSRAIRCESMTPSSRITGSVGSATRYRDRTVNLWDDWSVPCHSVAHCTSPSFDYFSKSPCDASSVTLDPIEQCYWSLWSLFLQDYWSIETTLIQIGSSAFLLSRRRDVWSTGVTTPGYTCHGCLTSGSVFKHSETIQSDPNVLTHHTFSSTSHLHRLSSLSPSPKFRHSRHDKERQDRSTKSDLKNKWEDVSRNFSRSRSLSSDRLTKISITDSSTLSHLHTGRIVLSRDHPVLNPPVVRSKDRPSHPDWTLPKFFLTRHTHILCLQARSMIHESLIRSLLTPEMDAPWTMRRQRKQ